MDEKCFRTETDTEYARKQSNQAILVAFAVLSILACFGLLITWQAFVFFEVIILISCVMAKIIIKRNYFDWELRFENDILHITNFTTGEVFSVWDIPASDFMISQSKQEMQMDYCRLLIKNTVFAFGGVKNCSQLKKYIAEQYK